MSESHDIRVPAIPPFNGENYATWKLKMELLLDEQGLLECLDQDYFKGLSLNEKKDVYEKRLKKDKKCKTNICLRVADSHLEYCQDIDTSYGIWKNLSDVFEKKAWPHS